MKDKEMQYTGEDGETYVAPLSIQKMDKIYNELRNGNKLKIYLLVAMGIIAISLWIIIRTGVLTQMMRQVVC